VVESVLACPLPIPPHHTSTLDLALPPSHTTTPTRTSNNNLVDTKHHIDTTLADHSSTSTSFPCRLARASMDAATGRFPFIRSAKVRDSPPSQHERWLVLRLLLLH